MLRRHFNFFRQGLSGFVRPDSEGERVNPQMFFEVTGKCGGVHLQEILLGVYSHFLLSTIFFSFSERSASLTNTTSPLRRVTSRASSVIWSSCPTRVMTSWRASTSGAFLSICPTCSGWTNIPFTLVTWSIRPTMRSRRAEVLPQGHGSFVNMDRSPVANRTRG